MLRNTHESYGWATKIFHWLIALLIIGLLVVGNVMTEMEGSSDKYKLYNLHKSIGITVLALAALRLGWRLLNTAPRHADIAPWQALAASIVHRALYGCMFAMPVSGWAMSSAGGHPIHVFGLITLPPLVEKNEATLQLMQSVHWAIGWTLVMLIALHAGAALLHHFYYKDSTLRRML